MKKIICLVLTAALFTLVTGVLPAAAAQAEAVRVTVDGNDIEQEYNPVWNDSRNRIMIKPQFFADFFDAEVSADGSVTTVSKNGHELMFTESETRLVMDGIGGRNLESANIAIDGEVYVPLRFTCESLGAIIEWDGNAASVTTGELALPEDAVPYLKDVTVFDQSTIRIGGDKVVYIDPYRIAGAPHDADVILVTHTHGDHFDIESIKKVMKDSTILMVAGEGGAEKAIEEGIAEATAATPNNTYTVDGITIKTIPAYNTSAARQNHKPEHGFVGYIAELNGVTYYSAGDTDYIDDMNALDVDVAFLPIDGRFNMEETEAARAANAIAPKVAIPYHYNNFSTEAKARDFVSLLDDGITGVIMTFRMYGN